MSNKPLIISITLNVLLSAGIGGLLYLNQTEKTDTPKDKVVKVEQTQNNKKEPDKKVDLSSLKFKNEKDLVSIQDGFILVYDNKTKDSVKAEVIKKAQEKELKITLLNLEDKKDRELIEKYINKNQKDIKTLTTIQSLERKVMEFQDPAFLETKQQLTEIEEKLNKETDSKVADELSAQQKVLIDKLAKQQADLSQRVFTVLNDSISFVANYRGEQAQYGEVKIEEILKDEKIKAPIMEKLVQIEGLTPLTKEELFQLIALNMQRPNSVVFKEIPKNPTLLFVYNHNTIESHELENISLILEHQLVKENKKFNIKQEFTPDGKPIETTDKK